jgi:magnesium transporter
MDTDEKLLAKFIQNHTSEVVLKIEGLAEGEIAALLESLSYELSALLISQMDRFIAARSLEKMNLDITVQLMEKLPLHVAETLLRQLGAELRNSILSELPGKVSDSLKQILKYPKNTVGAFLDPKVFTLFEDNTVQQSMEKIKKNNPPIDTYIFIISRNQRLIGSIELRQLITTEVDKQIRSLAKRDLPKVSADMNISEVDVLWEKDGQYSQLPVVDPVGIFLGAISRETVAKRDVKKSTYDHHASQTSSALGDLYKIGFSSLFRSASEIVGNQNLK